MKYNQMDIPKVLEELEPMFKLLDDAIVVNTIPSLNDRAREILNDFNFKVTDYTIKHNYNPDMIKELCQSRRKATMIAVSLEMRDDD